MTIQGHARDLFDQLQREDDARVRVAVFGQPGAGKSSLVNGLTGRSQARVGVHTDTTTDARVYACGQLDLIDLPGYGTERFPSATYAERFQTSSFDLFLCVTSNKLTQSDVELFRALRAAGKTCIFVRHQADTLWAIDLTRDELERGVVEDIHQELGDGTVTVLFTSCRTGAGLDALSSAISTHLGAAQAERWARCARAAVDRFLEQKHEECAAYVEAAARTAALNALNPIPGADVAIDVGVVLLLLVRLRHAYGLGDQGVPYATLALPTLATPLRLLVEQSTRHGALLLLQRFAARRLAQQVLKYIPILGQAAAAGLGYTLASSAGARYAEDCAAVARALLEHELGVRPAQLPSACA